VLIYLLFMAIPILAVTLLALFKPAANSNTSWVAFMAKGKDAGFSFREISLLRKLAVKSHLEDPASLFWSQKQLDRCIAALLRNTRLSGEDRRQSTQDFIAKLYEYRKKIEFEKPRYKKGIPTSRQIEEGQPLRILAESMGVYKSRMVKNSEHYMTIARPVSPNLPLSFSWNGLKIAVYFWRRDDAGYVFDTVVTDEVYSKGVQALQINHSESLFRTQKRMSIRIKTKKPAFLYLPDNGALSDAVETKPGLKCIVEDLSDSGCALTIGGKAMQGLKVKAQFALSDAPVVMRGIVRSTEYNEETGRSLLHIEADTLPMAARNRILGEVFGVQNEEDYLIPFQLLEDENEENENKSDENPGKIQDEALSIQGDSNEIS
jgi:c-di-GMP-binding flagellar brake protein YcgR